MSILKAPSLPLPEPLRAAEVPSFTNYSVVVRLPEIARRTLAENDYPQETVARIEALINEIPQANIRPLALPRTPDLVSWWEYVRPYTGMNWLQIPWFFAEEYFYLRILEATGYFLPGPWYNKDPYAHQKQMGLESSREPIRRMAEQIGDAEKLAPEQFRDTLARLLFVDLWGNQNDLSMWPVSAGKNGQNPSGGSAAEANRELETAHTHILADDSRAVLDYIEHIPPGRLFVDIALDNAGYELMTDLALADFLLTTRRAARVTLHAKSHPVFVSDAMNKDVMDTLDYLMMDSNHTAGKLAIRLRNALVEDRLQMKRHPFWVSPLPAWEMPDDLFHDLSESDLLIVKGDANYRRLLGDLHWKTDQPFASVVNYLPMAVLALRTLKSEIALGIPACDTPTADPQWMINGRWGLIQFAAPR